MKLLPEDGNRWQMIYKCLQRVINKKIDKIVREL